MPLTNYDLERCQEALNVLSLWKSSDIFEEPIDPIKDECPDYFEYVTRPSCLQMVRRKLQNNEYNTIAEFKEDVELIWQNTFTYYGEKSFVGMIASTLKSEFDSATEWLTDNAYIDWINQLDYLTEKLADAQKAKQSMKSYVPLLSVPEPQNIAAEAERGPPSQEDIQQLADDMQKITDRDDLEDLIRFIKQTINIPVKGQNHLEMNLADIGTYDFYKLRDHVNLALIRV